MAVKIHFEDHGQDFLTWEANDDGLVVNSWPFQQSIWAGSTIVDLHSLEPGKQVRYLTRYDGREMVIRYPVEKIEFTNLNQ